MKSKEILARKEMKGRETSRKDRLPSLALFKSASFLCEQNVPAN
jgi:hypothetical protein